MMNKSGRCSTRKGDGFTVSVTINDSGYAIFV